MHANYIKAGSKKKNRLILNQLETILSKLKNYKSHATENKKTIDYFLYSVKQARLTIKKNLFRIHLHEFLYKETTSTETELLASRTELVNDLEQLKEEYIQLWNRENRRHWLSENTAKFEALIESTKDLGGIVLIEPIKGLDRDETQITMRTVFKGYPIYYSIGKDTVTTSSTLYTNPFSLQKAAKIRAVSYNKEKSKTVHFTNLLYHKALVRLHHLASTPSS